MKLPVWMQYKDDDAHAQARGAHLSLGAGCTSQSLGRGDDGSTRTRTKEREKGEKESTLGKSTVCFYVAGISVNSLQVWARELERWRRPVGQSQALELALG